MKFLTGVFSGFFVLLFLIAQITEPWAAAFQRGLCHAAHGKLLDVSSDRHICVSRESKSIIFEKTYSGARDEYELVRLNDAE